MHPGMELGVDLRGCSRTFTQGLVVRLRSCGAELRYDLAVRGGISYNFSKLTDSEVAFTRARLHSKRVQPSPCKHFRNEKRKRKNRKNKNEGQKRRFQSWSETTERFGYRVNTETGPKYCYGLLASGLWEMMQLANTRLTIFSVNTCPTVKPHHFNPV